MIYFLNASGDLVHCLPESVYQGSAEGNRLFLVSPHAASTEAWAAFRLPDGTVTPRFRLEYAGVLQGYTGADGAPVCGWSLELPASVTAQYGTVGVQFSFLSAGQGQEASAEAKFTVERGVPSQLPDSPESDAYGDILSALSALRADLINGYYPARACVALNDGHTYGANEIVYCPETGEYGALLRSKVQNNVQPPFVDGKLNEQNWEMIVSFDTIAEDYFSEIRAMKEAAQGAESAAAQSAQAAKQSAAAAQQSRTEAEEFAGEAHAQATEAKTAADGAATAAAEAAASAQSAAADAQGSAAYSARAERNANTSLSAAAEAKGYMEQAKEYAKREYKLCASSADLTVPGDSAFIYLVPSSNGVEGDRYSEYLWIEGDRKYEYIGSVNDVDLASYAQSVGTYPAMNVGGAERLTRQSYIGVSSGAPGWYQVGHISAADIVSQGNNVATSSVSVIFLVNGMNGTGTRSDIQPSGLLEVDSRIASDLIDNTEGYTGVKVLAGNLIAEDYCVKFDDTRENLYLYKNMSAQYMAVEFVVVSEQYGTYPTKAFVFDGTFESAEMPAGGIVGSNVNRAADDGNGDDIAATYARQDGSYPAMRVGALARMGVASGNNTEADIGWWKLGEVTAASLTNVVSFGGDYSVLFLFNGVSPMGSTENYAQSGMVELDGRVTNGAFVTGGANQLKILSGNLEENDVAAVWSADKIELYCNLKTTYSKQAAVVLSEIIHTSAANCFAFAPSYASASLPAGALYAVNMNHAAYEAGNKIAMTYARQEGVYPALTAGKAVSDEEGANIVQTYARQNGTYSDFTAGKAVADGEGNDIAATYARQSGNYPDLSVGSATSASQASFATSDSLGNNIANTYAKQDGTYYSMTVGKARADEYGSTISSTYLKSGDLLGFSQIHEKTQVYSILRQRSVLFAFCQNEETFGVGGHTAQFAIMFRLEEAGTIFVFSVNNGSVSVDNINLMNCELDPQEHNLFYMTIYPF